MATAKKEVAVPASSDNMPAFMKGKDQSRGNENVGTKDLQLPRIDVLQALSPQLKKNDADFIEGAEQGMLFNTLTGDVYETLKFIPVFYRKVWLIWKDRKAGGGLRGVYDSEAEAQKFIRSQEDAGQLVAQDTYENLILIVEENGELTEAILSMAKSKAKVARKFNSVIRLNGGDRFSRVYTLAPAEDQNAAGEDFWNVQIQKNTEWVTEEQYAHAEKLYTSIAAGERKVSTAYEGDDDTVGGSEAATEI